nr:hypothetical protein [Tanacetum cinerariifolium]
MLSRNSRKVLPPAPAALPSPPLPPSLYPPQPIDRKDDIPKSEQPPRKRLCLSTLGSKYEVGESSTRGRGVDYRFADTVEAGMRHRAISRVAYEIRDTWIDPTEADPKMAPTTLEEVNTRVTELAELHEHDTQDLYALLEDAQDGRTRISQQVTMDSDDVDDEYEDMDDEDEEEEEERIAPADSTTLCLLSSLFPYLREQSQLYHHPLLTLLPLELGLLSDFRLLHPCHQQQRSRVF